MAKKNKEIPKLGHEIIETHCHLDYLKENSFEDIMAKCEQYSISKIVTIAVEPENLKTVRELSQRLPNIYGTQGVHPHDAKLFNEEVLKEIKEHAKHPKIVAIGEIGLDFHYNHSKKDEQIKAFESQLQLASDLDMPVVIHSRDAESETMAVLKNFEKTLKKKGVIHSFTSHLNLAKYALENDFYLGFNGIITFNSAENVRDALRLAPIERVLVETDSPFLTPVPYRGKENAPFYLPFIIEKIAAIKELPVDSVANITTMNAKKLFSF